MIDLYGYEGMTNHKELLKQWGPQYWISFREMMANYDFAGWTLDLMAYAIYKKVNNLFISTADEATIEKYESLFGIIPSDDQTLEERRAIVFLRYIGKRKLSFSAIQTYIKQATGGECDIEWEDGEHKTLRVRVYRDGNPINNHNALYDTIKHKLPVHIAYNLQYVSKAKISISVSKVKWKHIFQQTGTFPKVNVGLGLHEADLNVEVSKNSYKARRPMTGEVDTGTFPGVSVGLKFQDIGLDIENAGTGYKTRRLMSGDTAGDAGEYPITNIGYEDSASEMFMGVTAHGWPVSYQLCGDESL